MKKPIDLLFLFYKKIIKNVAKTGKCIYYPTCSDYSHECFRRFNFFKASFLTIKRLSKCNPNNDNDYDPVPLKKYNKFIKCNKKRPEEDVLNTDFIVEQNTHFNNFIVDRLSVVKAKNIRIYDY